MDGVGLLINVRDFSHWVIVVLLSHCRCVCVFLISLGSGRVD